MIRMHHGAISLLFLILLSFISSAQKQPDSLRLYYAVRTPDSIVEGEMVKLSFLLRNASEDTLKINFLLVPDNIQYRLQEKIKLNGTAQQYVNVSANDVEPQTYSNGYSEKKLSPHDSLQLEFYCSFSLTDPFERDVFVYRARDNYSNSIRLRVYPGVMKNSNPDDDSTGMNYFNGKRMTRISRANDSTIHYQSWFKNGLAKSDVYFDKKLHHTGNWRFWYENGDLLSSSTYRKGKLTNLKTWYPNGNLKSDGSYIKTCKIGKWEEFHENGKQKSDAVFRKHLLVVLFPYKLGIKMCICTSAKYYREWYANGKQKFDVQYSRNGTAKGNWTAWYDNGNLNSIELCNKKRKKQEWYWYNPNGSSCGSYKYSRKKNNYQSFNNCQSLLTNNFPQLLFQSRTFRSRNYGGGKF